ncbi:autotransporter-associated beta strand repeat-containing protein [Reyranella sp.]|uniref:autotransporter-associated beta strand repeat-containing protein n=1 Tax=Reyranella sp. TaxID=1929291 RepID=UPI003BA86F60
MNGTGTVTLSGANNHTGATTVSAGTLAAGAANTFSSDSAVSVGASGTLALQGFNQTIGSLAGSGTLRNGAVGAAALTAGGDASSTTFSGQIQDGGAGALALTKSGTGTLTLGGANTYTGGTTVSGGTVAISADNNLGNAAAGLALNGGTLQSTANLEMTRAITMTGTGTMQTDSGTTLVSNGVIGGGGNLIKSGAGTLTVTANNTYAGTTTVSGALQVGNGGTTGTLGGGAVTNNGQLTFNRSNDITVANDIGGTGALTKEGAGILTLTGTNAYTGATTVNTGTLALSGGSGIGSSSLVTVAGGATFDTSANVGFTQVNALAGAGTVVTGGGLAIANASTTFSGAINGGGGLEIAGGTQTLTGTNGYTNTTQIDGGATLALGGAGSIASSASVTFFGAGTFDVSQASSGASVRALVDFGPGGGNGRVSLGAGTLAITSGSTFNGVIQDGGIGGGSGGAVTIAGGATQDLGGINTYTGATTIEAASTLNLAGNGSIAASSGVNLAGAGALLDVSGGAAGQTIRDLSGVAGSTVELGSNALTVGTASSTLFAGAITDGSGPGGSLVKVGTGVLTLTGANTYTGGTTVAGGGLLGTTTSLQGDILNNGAVGFSQAGSGTYGGNMSGTGSLTLLGGTVTLTGTNTYSGGTTVSGGVLQGTTSSLQGNILNDSSVVFDQAGSGSYAGTMSGSGMLTKSGSGQLALTGANSYSGGTLVSAGVLQGTTSSLQGTIVNNAQVTFQQATTGTYAGNMSGTGSLLVNGTGTVILIGNNTYSGGTTVSGGVLQGTTSSLQGSILNNAMVTFNQTGTGTYAGVMSGTGAMTLQGGGVLTLTGANTYSGGTTVDASTLVVNGSLASAVTLSNGGLLGGSGTIGGLSSNGGTVAPGNSIGTLTVNGNFAQVGGTYVVEANAQGQSDRINATGTATISGGATVSVLAAAGTYQRNTTYTILNATGGVSGTYSGVTSDLAFLTPSLSYDASNVFLTLAMSQSAFASGARTANQQAVGTALDQANTGATGDFDTVLNALASLGTQRGPWALNQISGQPYADFGTANLASNALFMNALGQQMALARGARGSGQRVALAEACDVAACDGASPFSVWASGLGGFGSVQGNGNASTFTYNVGGTAAGIDYRVSPNVLLGIGAGYASGTQWADGFQGKGWTNAVSVAAYGSFTPMGPGTGLYADLLAGYAYANNRMQRQLSIPGLQPRTANGSTGANQFMGQAELGYRVPVHAQIAVTPFARLQAMTVDQAAFSEWGADSLSLNVAQQTTNSLRSTLGAELTGSIALDDTRTLDMVLRLGWQHEYADTARPVTTAFAGAPSNGFTVYGATPARDSAVLGFSAETDVEESASIYLRYDGDIGSGTDTHALTAGLRISW